MCGYRTVNVFDHEELAQTLWGITFCMESGLMTLLGVKIFYHRKYLVVKVSDKKYGPLVVCLPNLNVNPKREGPSFFLINTISKA